MRAYLAGLAGGVTLLLAGCGQAAGEGPERASVMFNDNCAPCHGTGGHGKPEIKAPNIAGLPDWYVKAQLMKFRMGIRGAHGDDLEGLRMRPMSRTLPAADVEPMAVYVSTLEPAPEETQLAGDPTVGKNYYATCAACHGQEGKGQVALNAPPIGMLQSWYIETQLTKFRHGIRGAHPDDVTGQQMAPMAKTIPNDQAVTDLAAYVSTL